MKTLLLLVPLIGLFVSVDAGVKRHDLGHANRFTLSSGGRTLGFYGSGAEAKADLVLLTHHRRDFIGRLGERSVAPLAEQDHFTKTLEYWTGMAKKRFHYYTQQSTKIIVEPIKVDRWVKEGDVVEWNGHRFDVLETPGFSRGAVSYLGKVDGKRVAFTGDLIYGDGKILDLYSFQDSIPEANIGGYHGYGARLAQLVSSLRKIKEANPEVIYPGRGPVIENPEAAIDKLIGRVKALYGNYLSTNALNWYFGGNRMRICGERVLGKGSEIELMPKCLYVDTPDWIIQFSTSRIIVSDDGHGFLLDCGGQRQFDYVKGLVEKGVVKKIDGIFVTHTHDDHSHMVKAASEEFGCPVYSTIEYEDVLENPGHYLMPGLTENAVADVKGMKDGAVMKWREYEFMFRYYPGQMFYHGALLVKRPKEDPVFFIGDSFAPTGIDDYCLLNRNLVHEDSGYPRCFKIVRQLPKNTWLVNEHVPHLFRFSDKELTYLETRYAERTKILRKLFPWDDPNYGIDERWATFYPYGNVMKPGETREIEVRLSNHSPVKRDFRISPRGHQGVEVLGDPQNVSLGSREDGKAKFSIRAPNKKGVYVITADVDSDNMHFRDWLETIIEVR